MHRDDEIYFPKPIETLIEEDLERLVAEKQKIKNGDNDNDNDDDEDDDKRDEDNEEGDTGDPDVPPGSTEQNSDDSEGDSDTGEMVKVTPQFMDGLVPGLDYTNLEEVKEYFDGEDLILGVRIYTQGGKVVSLTGKVIGEKVDVEEKDKKSKGISKGQGKKDDKDDEDAWEDED